MPKAAATDRPDLGLTGDQLLDTAAFAASIAQRAETVADPAALRPFLVKGLKEANDAGRAAIAAALSKTPYATQDAIRAYSDLTDRIVTLTLDLAIRYFHPNPNPTAGEQICLLAVGGYGRAEMAPFSDVDLLFLTPYKQTAWGESVIETTLYILWDLSLKIGHAVRTVDDCIRLGKDDITIRTALLEHRYLTGAKEMAEQLNKRLWKELFDKTGPQFVEAKLDERAARHNRHGGSRYVLEPNVKEGKGGLRDLQTLFWIAKYLNHATTPEDLVERGVFTPEEMAVFREAEAFLWSVRVHLHLYAGRANEQLTFDAQVHLAKTLGFRDSSGQRGVERFMQTWFTYARQVGELTRIFLVALESEHVKKPPMLTRAIRAAFAFASDKPAEGYFLNNGRLDMDDPEAFEKDPINILRLFQVGLSTGVLIHPNVMRRLTNSLHLIDAKLRKDAEANRVFLDILIDSDDPIRGLRRMNEMGALGAFIPEFGHIVAMMQFNMYHHYTVDEHTIRCLDHLVQIEAGALADELPLATEIMAKGVNRRVLYLALFLHDIGKGREEDHSDVGARIAARVCKRMGIPSDETETIVWLVQNHLQMSDFAQRRDLADARTISDFAQIVQSPARLRLLCVLTVCDIRGVGPGVWNNWKAMLLRELYARTYDHLTSGDERSSRPERIDAAKQEFAEALSGWSEAAIEAETRRHYDSFWLGMSIEAQVLFTELLAQKPDVTPAIDIAQDPARDATRACFSMADHPGVFSRLAGALSLAGADVVDARTYTTSDGYVTAIFWLQDREGRPFASQQMARLRKSVARTLSGEVIAQEEFRTKDKIKKREKDFIVPTEITIDNDGSEICSIIEVDTRDRPGLLYDLSRTLTDCGISISSALVTTYGEQAVDSFYVKDLFGHKLHSKSKQERVVNRLREAIRQGAERAAA
ncbi:[protein-PII] uridylyltransferase [Halovulum sp. GXIMD14793]